MDEDNLGKYDHVKNELDKIYNHIAEGTRIRSKCDWYNHGEKSTKFFLNLEKQRGSQNTIKKLVVDDKGIIEQTHILEHIREFYETLFKTREQKTEIEMENSIFQNSLKIKQNFVRKI